MAWGKNGRNFAFETQDAETSLEIGQAGEQGQDLIHTLERRLFVALWVLDGGRPGPDRSRSSKIAVRLRPGNSKGVQREGRLVLSQC